MLRNQAADNVVPVFAIDYVGMNTAARSLGKLFDRLETLRQPTEVPPAIEHVKASLTDALSLLGMTITAEDALALAPEGREKHVLATVRKHLRMVWDQGIVSEREKTTQFDRFATKGNIRIRTDENDLRSPIFIHVLHLPSQATHDAVQGIRDELVDIEISTQSLETLLRQWLLPNLRYDATQTDLLRAEEEKSIRTVQKIVLAGTTLVEAGERITPQIMEDILAHQQKRAQIESPRDRILDQIGHGALLMLGLVMSGGLIRVMRPELLLDTRKIALMAVISLFTIFPAKVLLYISLSTKLLPHSLLEPLVPLALAPLLGSILAGGPAAIAIGVWTSFVVSMLYSHSYSMFILGLVVTMIVAGSAREIRKRSRLFRIGITIGLAAVAVVLCFGALNQQSAEVLAPQIIAAFLGGLLCALFAGLFIPLFEWTFRLTTDITLLELSDMGHPLLRRLAMEAPGTYHHSLMVANLSQSAASEIGANSLLIRVCAYFHDIGKMTKPEFFVENTQYSRNPHDDLSPSMSALVLMSHVKEGLALAQRYALPTPVLDGIAQHHGTGLIYYFYHRALKEQEKQDKAAGGRPVDQDDFRYPGPKPQTQEMGILLLADSVEAASRTMEKPSVTRIDALVNEIVDARLQDGQLDECDLTFRQLADIKRSFIFALTNMLHGRVKYPKHEDTDQQSPKPTPSKQAEIDLLQPMAHGTG